MCGLLKYTVYSLSILCFTNSGNRPTTLPLQLHTLEDVPDEVTEIASPNVYDKSLPSQPTQVFQSSPDVPFGSPDFLSVRLKALTVNSTESKALTHWSSGRPC